MTWARPTASTDVRDERLQQRRADLAGRLGQAGPGDLRPVGRQPGRARARPSYNQIPVRPIGSANFVGSGTSFSAAITSGAAALVLADNPGLTPNQVKARLLGNTNPGPVGNPFVDGHGALNAYAAATCRADELSASPAWCCPPLPGLLVSLVVSLPGRHLERRASGPG